MYLLIVLPLAGAGKRKEEKTTQLRVELDELIELDIVNCGRSFAALS